MPTVVAPVIAAFSAISSLTETDVASSPSVVTCTVAVAPSNVMEVTSSVAAGPCAPGVVNSTVSE